MGKMSRTAAALAGVALATGLAMGGGVWQGQPYSLTVPTHVSAPGGAVGGSVVLALDHDVACTISVTATAAGSEVLRHGGQSLTTYYKLTGSSLGDPDPNGDQPADPGWIDSSTFITRQYHTSNPSNHVVLCVKGVAPSNQAVDAGAYTGSLTLTATW